MYDISQVIDNFSTPNHVGLVAYIVTTCECDVNCVYIIFKGKPSQRFNISD